MARGLRFSKVLRRQRQAPMTISKFFNVLLVTAVTFAALALCPVSFAQGPSLDAPMPTGGIEPSTNFVPLHPIGEGSHKFWDRENTALFVAAAAMNGADFAVTHANLQSGGQELNPVVRVFGRSSGGLAV